MVQVSCVPFDACVDRASSKHNRRIKAGVEADRRYTCSQESARGCAQQSTKYEGKGEPESAA